MNESATPPERWLPVVGYEGLYAISDWGRVRSLARMDRNSHRHPELVMQPQTDKKGYLQVTLSKDRVKTRKFVHTLVLEAFVGPCPVGMETCHDPDYDPVNNRLENLRWDTREANREDTRRQGRPLRQKSNAPACKHGHEYTEENTYWYRGVRNCRACQRETMRARRGTPEFTDTHCDKGHELTPENSYRDGRRTCRACLSIKKSAAAAAKKATQSG